jgi:spoIIIJ-associated protein
MNERTTLEKIAPTVDEAVSAGLTELGMTAEAVDVEVLDSGSRGLFGVGSRQARVRLTVKNPLSGFEVGAKQTETVLIPAASSSDKGASPEISEDAFNILDDNLLDEQGQRPVLVDVQGDDLGVLIGRRAEILNALQYIVNLIVSKQVERWVQVVIDVQGYRARHERQLRQMAQRMADQAMKAGRRQVLEPMSASDRRIIHLELRDHPSVTTQSVGEEPTRKVTIIPKE